MAVPALSHAPDACIDLLALGEMFSTEALHEPMLYVLTQPANVLPTESSFWRKAPDDDERCEHPPMSPREPGYVMGGQ